MQLPCAVIQGGASAPWEASHNDLLEALTGLAKFKIGRAKPHRL